MTVKEASTPVWFFESHNNTKRSRWLQSTLSEFEEKTKGMLKLIEGEADTFAQRAEMYYKKRPELINMIEDFYRSYRSLAESYDQLKLESGNSLLNRRFSLMSLSNESLASSLVTSDSEVDDPAQEVESKLKEVHEISKKCKLEKSTEKRSEVCVVKPMVEEIRSKKNILTEDYANAASKMQINDKNEMHVYPGKGETHGDIELAKLTHSEFDFKLCSVSYPECDLEEFTDTKSEICVIKPMIEIEAVLKLSEAAKNYGESEVERLKGEIASYKVELGQKDEEKREVIRQLSAAVDILRGENDRLKKFIRDSKNRGSVFELGLNLKDVFCKNPFGKHFKFPTPLVAV